LLEVDVVGEGVTVKESTDGEVVESNPELVVPVVSTRIAGETVIVGRVSVVVLAGDTDVEKLIVRALAALVSKDALAVVSSWVKVVFVDVVIPPWLEDCWSPMFGNTVLPLSLAELVLVGNFSR
jgi:hypothetical protein